MLELHCRGGAWYRCFARLPADAGYVVLSLQPLDAQGAVLGAAQSFALRPGRRSQRVVLTPAGCHTLKIGIFKGEPGLLESLDLTLVRLWPWHAGALMLTRLKHHFPQASFSSLDRLFPSRLYSRYQDTQQYYPLPFLQPRRFSGSVQAAWPALHCLTLDDLNSNNRWSENDWLVLKQPGDAWLEDGPSELAFWQQRHPEAQVIVFDEQRLDAGNGVSKPWLKPRWNPDLFLSSAYLGRGVAFRGDLFSRLLLQLQQDVFSGPDELVDALVLQLMAAGMQACNQLISTCQKSLLQVSTDSLNESDEKAFFQARQQRLQQLLVSQKQEAQVEPGVLSLSWRLRWPLPDSAPLVSLCIPTRNGLAVLQPCVEALLNRTDYQNFELLIVDNQSDCSVTLKYLADLQASDQRVRVLSYDKPFNFAAINNFAASHARGEVVGLVNNDIEPRHSDWLGEMVSQVLRPEVGCVGAKLYYPNGRIQHAGVVLGIGGIAGHAFRFSEGDALGYQGRLQLVQNYSAVTAACLLVRKSVFDAAGGMDERFAVAYNDVDFCLKVQSLGYRNLWTPYAELTHHESVTRGKNTSRQQRRRADQEFALMREKWGGLLNDDPAYHPKLTRVHEDFSLGVSEWR